MSDMGLDRRTFIASGLTLSVAAGVGLDRAAAAVRTPPVLLFVDTALDAAAASDARWQAALGARLIRYRHDITAAWLETLQGRWDGGSPMIAGVTTRDARFVMEVLARGHRHRLLADRASAGRDGTAAHRWLIGSPDARPAPGWASWVRGEMA